MTRVVGYEVSTRLQGTEDTDWVRARFPVEEGITLPGLVREGVYDVEIRSVGANGVLSAPATLTHTVAAAAREGSLALPTNVTGNIASAWDYDTEVTFSSTDSTCTVSITAGTLVSGSRTISYGASSVEVTVAPSETFTLYLWYDDPFLAGGTLDLEASRNIMDSVAGSGFVALAPLEITTPALGGPPTSGGGPIGGGGGGGGAGNIQQDPL
ncbi:MAG: hypothetical protein J7507_12175 [Pseudoxanthomonas sp.]|nr:hypothetical protein [Pseudoxanthomonas sp.]